jgi:phage protein D
MKQEKAMLKRLLAIALASILIHTVASAQPTLAGSKEDKQAKLAERVRAGIAKLGTGTSALVEVKLRDKTLVSGFISEADNSRFLVTDAKTGASTSVAYTDVTKVQGHNLSTGAKIGIGIAIGFLLTAAIVLLR